MDVLTIQWGWIGGRAPAPAQAGTPVQKFVRRYVLDSPFDEQKLQDEQRRKREEEEIVIL